MTDPSRPSSAVKSAVHAESLACRDPPRRRFRGVATRGERTATLRRSGLLVLVVEQRSIRRSWAMPASCRSFAASALTACGSTTTERQSRDGSKAPRQIQGTPIVNGGVDLQEQSDLYTAMFTVMAREASRTMPEAVRLRADARARYRDSCQLRRACEPDDA
jgi:hypothetical protein